MCSACFHADGKVRNNDKSRRGYMNSVKYSESYSLSLLKLVAVAKSFINGCPDQVGMFLDTVSQA